jgi:peptide/nickel transport system permease protein
MGLRWYVVRRLAWTVTATLVVLSGYFVLLQVAPGDGRAAFAFSAATEGGNATAAAETFDRIRGNTGTLFEQYVRYMGNYLTGDWGWSFTRNQPVTEAILQAYPYSLQYGLPAGVLAIVVGYGIGLYSATHQYTLTDYFGTFVAFFGISIPNFWFAIMLVLLLSVSAPDVTLFGVQLLPLPSFYQTGVVQEHGWLSWENVRQLLAPIFVLTTGALAGNMRYSRAEALEYVNAEFVKTARAKGASDWRVLSVHILRPAAVPLMTIFIADLLGLLLASSFLIEVVFQIPGLALLGYNAIVNQDTPLVMGTTLVPVLLLLLGNLLQDVAYTVLDPRIDYEGR